jgi:5'-3' exonuclease
MGIPSYYRKLASTVNGLYCEAPAGLDWFLMDYNCLIYQVLRSMPPMGDRLSWEKELIRATCDYTAELLEHVGARNVFIALDGTVPLAKMKQQRMRRFRAVELAAEERRLGLREGPSWDSNAITPGTAFMDALGSALRARFPEATISDVREPGEGEHKVMRHMRGFAANTKCAIYGLDGDLFVLALLNQKLYVPDVNIFFFREEEDKRSGTTELIWLSLARLASSLTAEIPVAQRPTWLIEYAIAMCLLGNDFVPQSMAFRIKEGGHERLIKMLNRLHGGGDTLMKADGSMDRDSWTKLFGWLAAEETWRLEKAIENKRKSRRTPVGTSATEAARAKMNDRPLEWFDEADGRLWTEGAGLKEGWKETYAALGLGAVPGAEAWYHKAAAHRYLESVEWTFKYYTSGITDWDWMYEFPAAPLFQYVADAAWPSEAAGTSEPPTKSAAQPTPEEQLALVLPPESYWLLPPCKERQFLAAAPEYFPKSWNYHHLGKRHFWECEAHIPLPTLRVLRQIVRALNVR